MDNTRPGKTSSRPLDDHEVRHSPFFYFSDGESHNERNQQTWTALFSSSQREHETVQQYSNRIVALADTLTDIEAELRGPIVFFRVKAGLKDSIKQVLNKQHLQPTSHALLNDVAMAIERDLGLDARPEQRPSVKNYSQNTVGLHRTLPVGPTRVLEQSRPLKTTATERSERADFDSSESTFPHDDSEPTALQDNGHYGVEKPLEKRQYGLDDDLEGPYGPSSTFNNDTGRSSQPYELPSPRQAHDTRNDHAKPTSFHILGSYRVEKPSSTSQMQGQAGTHHHSPPFNPGHGQPPQRMSAQEIERHKQANLCFNCGEPGHMKGECPQNPQHRRKRQKSRR
ncbi:MAG: hypothetical protein LQ346_004482 [Caloplaca aetnensis]|nr:MAG: hypothetical protein LQ346_004482 [Caloplaca aetnensis]